MIGKARENLLSILQIGGLGLPVRRDLKYGGTERAISYLTDKLCELGHKVTVAAPGDSDVSGILVPTITKSLWAPQGRLGKRDIKSPDKEYQKHYKRCIEHILEMSGKLDVVHDHPGSGLVTAREYSKNKERIGVPILTTLHGKYEPDEEEKYRIWRQLIKEGRPVCFNALSYSQKTYFENKAGIPIGAVIYHGLPKNIFSFEEHPEDYLFTIGRICPEKGQHLAIEIAKKTGRKLVIAGEVHSINEQYFKEMVEPQLDGDQIRYIFSLNDKEKTAWFKNATAFLMPIMWPEPFGLVMIESLATGTPLVAFNYGSVPEIIKDGKTGYVIDEIKDYKGNVNLEAMIEEAVDSVKKIDKIKRKDCMQHFLNNFTSDIEADNYIKLYKTLVNNSD